MINYRLQYCRNSLFICGFCTFIFSSVALGDALHKAISSETARLSAASKSQTRINKLDDSKNALLLQYRQMLHEIDNLKAYNGYLQGVVDTQVTEKTSLAQQVQDLEETQHEIVPLMLSMQSTLRSFVSMDIPFLPKERNQRLAKLDETMLRADTTVSEKFRHILEAYQIENDYGYTIEAYRGELPIEGQTYPVDFFRLGRVAMFYQTLDGTKTGVWNQGSTQWEALPDSYQRAVRDSLRIARKETAPNLLTLPLAVSEAVE